MWLLQEHHKEKPYCFVGGRRSVKSHSHIKWLGVKEIEGKNNPGRGCSRPRKTGSHANDEEHNHTSIQEDFNPPAIQQAIKPSLNSEARKVIKPLNKCHNYAKSSNRVSTIAHKRSEPHKHAKPGSQPTSSNSSTAHTHTNTHTHTLNKKRKNCVSPWFDSIHPHSRTKAHSVQRTSLLQLSVYAWPPAPSLNNCRVKHSFARNWFSSETCHRCPATLFDY